MVQQGSVYKEFLHHQAAGDERLTRCAAPRLDFADLVRIK
jgi:hypothetical protein